MKKLALTVLLFLAASACGGSNSSSNDPTPGPSPTPTPTPTPTPGPAGLVFRDTFTEAATRLLHSHTPDRGVRWNLNEDTTGGLGVLYVAAGSDWLTPQGDVQSARVSYYATPQPALTTANYLIEVTLDNQARGSSDDFTWLMLRRTDTGTYYGAGWYAAVVANDCYIFKVVGGAYTQLANGDCNFMGDKGVNGSVIRFATQDDALALFKDGALVLSAAGGSAITEAGAAGLGAGNIRNPTDDVSTALALDDLSIVEIR